MISPVPYKILSSEAASTAIYSVDVKLVQSEVTIKMGSSAARAIALMSSLLLQIRCQGVGFSGLGLGKFDKPHASNKSKLTYRIKRAP